MRLPEIEKKASGLGVSDTWKYSKGELIKKIQKTEGYSVCFGTASDSCGQMACCWRQDCVKR